VARKVIFVMLLVCILSVNRNEEDEMDREKETHPSSASNIRQIGSEGDLVGTWRLRVTRAASGQPPFLALHTYCADGTLIETTSVYGRGGEGPGHGVWCAVAAGFVSTFELFAFDEHGGMAGTVRVRSVLTLDGPNRLTGEAHVDLIQEDGTVIPEVDRTPFVGERLRM
jgi:hypothetical protein